MGRGKGVCIKTCSNPNGSMDKRNNVVHDAAHCVTTCMVSHICLHRLVLEGPGRLDPAPAAEGAAPPVPFSDALAGRIASHPTTNAEIRALCADLQVLGRSEFKLLLKWCACVFATVC